MKTLILAALAATLTLHAQQNPAPAKAEQTATVAPATTERAIPTVPPSLAPEDQIAIMKADVQAMKAKGAFAEFMVGIQRQLDAVPDYQKLKASAESAGANYGKIVGAALAKAGCPDCRMDPETLALTRPQIAAKAEEKKEK